jgi:hypothetical protein
MKIRVLHAVGGGIFQGDAKPPGLGILCGVDRLGTCKTKSYMEKPAFTRHDYPTSELSWLLCMYPLVEWLCQVMMGWISALENLLQGARGSYGHVLSC